MEVVNACGGTESEQYCSLLKCWNSLANKKAPSFAAGPWGRLCGRG